MTNAFARWRQGRRRKEASAHNNKEAAPDNNKEGCPDNNKPGDAATSPPAGAEAMTFFDASVRLQNASPLERQRIKRDLKRRLSKPTVHDDLLRSFFLGDDYQQS
jgi:hypothetical protein